MAFFLKTFIESCTVKEMSSFLAFRFDLLDNLRLEILKLQKQCTVRNFSSYKLGTGGAQRRVKYFFKIQPGPFRAFNMLFNSMESVKEFFETRTDVSKEWNTKWMGRDIYKD